MRKWMIVVVMAVWLSVGACVPSTAQIKTLTGTVDTLIATVDEGQEQLDDLVAKGIVSAEDAEKIKEEMGMSNSPVIISCRHLRAVYDVESLVKAVPLVLAKAPEAQFIIGSDGYQKDYLKNLMI